MPHTSAGLHTTSGRWKLGLGLSLGAVFMWGLLPIALSGLLEQLDPITITWFRFVGAGLVLLGPVIHSRGLTPILRGGRRLRGLFALAALGLIANYLLYVLSLKFVSPSAAQVLIQLAPMSLLLGGLLVFRERFVGTQRAGLAILLLGLALFFHGDLPDLVSGESRFLTGVSLLLGAAITWGVYALAQKQLLSEMSSPSIMVAIYIVSAAVLLPFSHPASVKSLDGVGLGLLVFLAVNTLAAYGCFAEALQHLEASRVSVVLSLTPLVTILVVTLGASAMPRVIERESLDWPSLAGAGLVVAGSMLGALGRRPGQQEPRAGSPTLQTERSIGAN
jgi:drug/metabolite transporter (DMT)-like permease